MKRLKKSLKWLREKAGVPEPSPLSGKIWRHDHRATTRLLIIGAGLLAAVLIFLGGLNIAETLSRLVSA